MLPFTPHTPRVQSLNSRPTDPGESGRFSFRWLHPTHLTHCQHCFWGVWGGRLVLVDDTWAFFMKTPVRPASVIHFNKPSFYSCTHIHACPLARYKQTSEPECVVPTWNACEYGITFVDACSDARIHASIPVRRLVIGVTTLLRSKYMWML